VFNNRYKRVDEMKDFWPNGYRSCVNFSFDFDSSSAETWRTPHDIVAQSKGRFASKVAIPRILKLLDEKGIKATFFVPGWTADNYPESVEDIISKGHEVAAHGYAHEKLIELSYDAERETFVKSLFALEKFDIMPKGFRAPYWEISERTIDFLVEMEFEYDSNFMDSDMPYSLIWRGKNTGLIELPVEWMLDDWGMFENQRLSPEQVYNIWKPEFDGIYELGRYFGLTCHPQVIGRISRIKMIEKLFEYVNTKNDVWVATCREISGWMKDKK
jgi:peptidoglycan/xylan/chitin deacetylase (PgdA/CDA1 family)